MRTPAAPNPAHYPLSFARAGRVYRYRLGGFWGVEAIFERARGGWARARFADLLIAIRRQHEATTITVAA